MPSKSVASGSGELLLGDKTASDCEFRRSWDVVGLEVASADLGDTCSLCMDDRIEGVERRTASWQCPVPGSGDGTGGVPRVYIALYSQVLDSLVQRWHGNVPEHLVFFLKSMSELLLRRKRNLCGVDTLCRSRRLGLFSVVQQSESGRPCASGRQPRYLASRLKM